jgi:hypothetical protein
VTGQPTTATRSVLNIPLVAQAAGEVTFRGDLADDLPLHEVILWCPASGSGPDRTACQ